MFCILTVKNHVFNSWLCADPESFARGGPTLGIFLFVFFYEKRGSKKQKALKVGHYQPNRETPFKCLLKRLQNVSADNKNIQLFVISALRVNTCEVSVYTVSTFMKCTHVCAA